MSDQPIPSESLLGIGGGILSMIGPLSIAILPPATQNMAQSFALHPAAIAATTSSFLIGLILAQLFCGAMSDAWGRRRVALGFLCLYVLASFAAIFVAALEQLLVLRLCQGIGAAVGIATARAMVRDYYVQKAAARVVNVTYLVLGIGAASGPLLGSLLVEVAGFRAIFLFLTGYGMILMLYLSRALPQTEPAPRRFLQMLPHRTFARLLRMRGYLVPAMAVAGVSGALYGQSAVLPYLLMTELGLTPFGFAMAVAVVAICHVTGSLSARFWMRVATPRQMVAGAALVILAACVWMVLAAAQGLSLIGLVGPVALAGFCASHSYPILVTATVEDLPEAAGAASSLLSCFQMGAGFLVAVLTGAFAPSVWTATLGLGASLCLAGLMGLFWARDSAAGQLPLTAPAPSLIAPRR